MLFMHTFCKKLFFLLFLVTRERVCVGGGGMEGIIADRDARVKQNQLRSDNSRKSEIGGMMGTSPELEW